MGVRKAALCLVTYRRPGSTDLHAGVLNGDQVCLPPQLAPFRGLMELLQDWPAAVRTVKLIDIERARPVPDAQLTAPLLYPRKMLFAGANYYSHVAEMGVAEVGAEAAPFFFLKPPSTSVIGPGEPILLDGFQSSQVDWEAELAVVIGRHARSVKPEAALEVVAGYTVANDVSDRAAHRRTSAAGDPFVWDWLASKGRDTFCPLGPGMVPAWEVGDPQQLDVRLWVNGVLKQQSSTRDMIVPVADLVAAASRIVALEPGDVIATGTPAGVGMPRGEFLRPGDVVRIEIAGVGTLENSVAERSSAPESAVGSS